VKYDFNKIYVFILILWIPFYYFWDWLRFRFVGDPSDGIRYVLEAFFIGLAILMLTSLFLAINNKFRNLWDYVILILAIMVFFLSNGFSFLMSYLWM